MIPQGRKILTSLVWNTILKNWDTLFEFMQIGTQYSENHFTIFYNVTFNCGKENWLGTIKATPKINKK